MSLIHQDTLSIQALSPSNSFKEQPIHKKKILSWNLQNPKGGFVMIDLYKGSSAPSKGLSGLNRLVSGIGSSYSRLTRTLERLTRISQA